MQRAQRWISLHFDVQQYDAKMKNMIFIASFLIPLGCYKTHHLDTELASLQLVMSMSGITTGATRHTLVQRMNGLGTQLDGELDLEEIGHRSEVVIPHEDIDLRYYLSTEDSAMDFTTIQSWKSVCLQRLERLVEHTPIMGTNYLVFRKVTKEDLVKVDRSRHGLPLRIFYDSITELLIVKLMVGKAHELIGNLFASFFIEKVRASCGDVRALYMMGAFRCTSTIGRKKEPDVALVPRNRNQEADWPSVVIEVGVSESMATLKNDVHFWILHSNGLTRIVLLIVVDTQSRLITIERWGNEPIERWGNEHPPVYPSHIGPVIWPRMLQRVTIDDNGVVGAPFDVPSGLIFDVGNVPLGVLPTDFSFDAIELAALFEEFWGMLN